MKKTSLFSLSLLAPKGADVLLFDSFSEGTLLSPLSQEDVEDRTRFCYSVAAGRFRVKMSAEGYVGVLQFLALTEKELDGGYEFVLPAHRREGKGFEPQTVRYYDPKVWDTIAPSDKALWEEEVPFVSPAFHTDGMFFHRATTHEELLAFIDEQEKNNPRLKRFAFFTSPTYQYEVPILLFSSTDLTQIKTLREAASLLRTNGRPVVHIQAQIHGDEIAAGEGVMSVIYFLGTPEGQKLLENIDVYVIPRLNPDGAHDFIRNNVQENANMNRDFLELKCQETSAAVSAFRLFMPEIFIDCHEYTGSFDNESGPYYDMMLSRATDLNTGKPINDAALQVIYSCFETLAAHGLRGAFYRTRANGTNAATGTRYAAAKGALPFLVESRGKEMGTCRMARRVAGQFLAVRTILEQVAARPVEFRELVATESCRLYDNAGKDFVLHSAFSRDESTAHRHPSSLYDFATGEILRTEDGFGFDLDQILRQRKLPRAYVLPCGEPWEEQVITTLKKHGIAFRRDEAGTAYSLSQYRLTGEEVTFSARRRTAFQNGCYYIPVNQISSVVLACILEPDVNDVAVSLGTFAQRGVIPVTNGKYPIYRED